MKTPAIIILLTIGLHTPALCQVDTAWVRRYDEPYAWNFGECVVADSSGNVFVTGESDTGDYAMDIVTIKYDRNGNELWKIRYDGSAHDQDYGRFIAVAGQNRIVVLGSSTGETSGDDIVVIMYDGDGNEIWMQRYDGLGNDFDWPQGIAIGSTGDIYITGRSDGGGYNDDMITLKYDIDGNLQWEKRYDGIGSWDWGANIKLSLDENYVYVAGPTVVTTMPLNYDIITKCYRASNGMEMWSNTVDTHNRELVWSLAIDSQNNVFVIGEAGPWEDANFVTVKYDQAGNIKWFKIYDGPSSGNDVPYCVSTDNQGSVYAAGRSQGNGTDYDLCLIKYDSLGNEEWVNRYNGPGNGEEWVYWHEAITSDNDGNIYITFSSVGSGTGKDYCTICYTPDGSTHWLTRYDAYGYDDEPYAIFLDDSGYVYVTGVSKIVWPRGYLTVKYCQSTGIAENLKADVQNKLIKVYPNPIIGDNGVLHLSLPSGLKGHSVSIALSDICGREVMELFEGKIECSALNIKIKELPAGIYFIAMKNQQDKSIFTQKIVKID